MLTELTTLGFEEPPALVGVSGTLTTLVTTKLGMARYDARQVNEHRLSIDDVRSLQTTYCSLALAERRQLPGLAPQRGDIIIAGALIVTSVLCHFNQRSLVTCDRGVRWGVLGMRVPTSRTTRSTPSA